MRTKEWNEFRETGLLVFVNVFLHIFGYAIALEIEEDEVVSVYPQKVDYNGFNQDSMDRAYERVKKMVKPKVEEITREEKLETLNLNKSEKLNDIVNNLKGLKDE